MTSGEPFKTLSEWDSHVKSMEDLAPGFWHRHPLGVVYQLGGGYQFGYEISGYGTVVGYCTQHKPHKTDSEATECGSRFLAGRAPRMIDRMPWRQGGA